MIFTLKVAMGNSISAVPDSTLSLLQISAFEVSHHLSLVQEWFESITLRRALLYESRGVGYDSSTLFEM